MLNRDNIIQRAVQECLEEMYAKAQPSADYKELIEKVESGEIEDSNENPVYNRYYLSQEEFEYIRNKYVEAYDFTPHWRKDIEWLEEYLLEGGSRDKFIPDTMEEDGSTHPGYRSYEEVKPLKEQLKDIIHDDKQLNKVFDIVMNTIKGCKDYYRFDQVNEIFNYHICLGASPTSNKETVKNYWESQGKTIEFEDRNPLLFWDKEYYGSEFEEAFEEEYGSNWKEIWDKRYQDDLVEKKAKREAELAKAMENPPIIHKFKIGDIVRCKEDPTAREVFAIQPDGYRIVGGFIPFEEADKWYHCYEQFKNYW